MGESMGEKSKQINLFSRELEEEENREIEKGFMLGINCQNCGSNFVEQFVDGISVPSSEGVLQVFAYDHEKEDEGKILGEVVCPHCHIKEYLKVYWRLPIGFNQEWEGAGQSNYSITEDGDEAIH